MKATNKEYYFGVYSIDTDFNNIRAVYIFSKKVDEEGGIHEVLHIGETEELGNCIGNHEKWPYLRDNGVNCICVHADIDSNSRLNKLSDLVNKYDTLCSD